MPTSIENIVSGISAFVASIGALFYVVNGQSKKNDEQDKKIDLMLSEKTHEVLCKNASLEINKHVTGEFNNLKEFISIKFTEFDKALEKKADK